MKHRLRSFIGLCLSAAISLSFPASASVTVQEVRSPAGFLIWLVEDHALPLMTMNISFRNSGVAHDPDGKEGRTNMTAALLMEGAGSRNDATFNAALEAHAIRLTIGADDDQLTASLSTLTQHRDLAFELLGDSLQRPRLDAAAIERVRGKIQSLLSEQSEAPSYKLMKAFQAHMYDKHPYAQMGLGDPTSIARLTQDDFKDYLRRYLTQENIVISVVGDTTAQDIAALVDRYLGSLPTSYQPDRELSAAILPETGTNLHISHDMPQDMIAFGLPGLLRSDPDYIPGYVLNHILGGSGLRSRLGQEIRVKRGLSYGVHTQLQPKQYAGVWRGMFSADHAHSKEALEQLHQVLEDIRNHGVSADELADAKTYLTGSFILKLSSNQDVANFLTMMQIQRLGKNYLETRNALIERVTIKDIERVAARIMDPSRLCIVVVGKTS